MRAALATAAALAGDASPENIIGNPGSEPENVISIDRTAAGGK